SLGQAHQPEGGGARVEEGGGEEEGGGDDDGSEIADTVRKIGGGKLEDDHGEAEDGLEDHDVGERHADLVLPEESDDGNGKEQELTRGVGHEESDVLHGAAAREHEAREDMGRRGYSRASTDASSTCAGLTSSTARPMLLAAAPAGLTQMAR